MESASLKRGGCPFPGLRPYAFEESHLFFGRDKQIAELLQRLGRSRFLAVVGRSGGGKSSLVRAGLRPAILGGLMSGSVANWQVVEMRPGINPVLALKAAVKTALGPIDVGTIDSSQSLTEWAVAGGIATSKGLLVIADQFEEVFRISEPESARLFVEMLLSATEQTIPIYVVLTMRHDYLGDCSRFGGLPEALNRSQYLMPSLTREQRQEAILGPLKIAGVAMSPQLLQLLLSQSGASNWGGASDSLSVLQHTLFRTFQEWKRQGQDREIETKHYDACGGLDNALDKHATEVLESLPPTARHIAPVVFRCLTVADKGRFVRRPMRIGALSRVCGDANDDLVLTVTKAFSGEDNSLVSFRPALEVEDRGEGWVDIMHESLITHWKTLTDWCQQEADDAASYQELCRAAAVWARSRHKGDLLHANRLKAAEGRLHRRVYNAEWGALYRPPADFHQVQELVKASVSERTRRLALGGVATAVLATSVGVGWYLSSQQIEAIRSESQRAIAVERERSARKEAELYSELAKARSAPATTNEERMARENKTLRLELELQKTKNASLQGDLVGQVPVDQSRLLSALRQELEDERAHSKSASKQFDDQIAGLTSALKQRDADLALRNREIDALRRPAVVPGPTPEGGRRASVTCPSLPKSGSWFEHYDEALRPGTDPGLAISHLLAAIAGRPKSGRDVPRIDGARTGAGGTVPSYFPQLELAKLTRDLSDADLAACFAKP